MMGTRLAWLLDGWSGQQIAIAVDATSLGGIVLWYWLSVLSIAAVPVPVAWKVLKAQETRWFESGAGPARLARNRAQGLV